MSNSKIVKNVIMLLIIIALFVVIGFSGYYLFNNLLNNLKEGLTSGTSVKPYNVDTATRLAINAINEANREYPNACNAIEGKSYMTQKTIQSGLNALDATGITNPVFAIFNARCNWIWSDTYNPGTYSPNVLPSYYCKDSNNLPIFSESSCNAIDTCSWEFGNTEATTLGACIKNNFLSQFNAATNTNAQSAAAQSAAAQSAAAQSAASQSAAAQSAAAQSAAAQSAAATNKITLLQQDFQTAQNNLDEASNNLTAADNKMNAAEYDEQKAQDAINTAAASVPSAKTVQDSITAKADKILADAKILTAKEDQIKFKAEIVKATAEVEDARSKLIAGKAAALLINANPPSVIATTGGTPGGYQNTNQFDSVPGLTTGDNSARAISNYFGNLLQNLLTIVKHDQTHNAIANAHNILTNSGNRAYSTNLVSSQSAFNPQSGYPTMNYPDSSQTDLAYYTALSNNKRCSLYGTSNSYSCNGVNPLAYNCLSTSIDF